MIFLGMNQPTKMHVRKPPTGRENLSCDEVEDVEQLFTANLEETPLAQRHGAEETDDDR